MKRAIINGKYVENPTSDELADNTRFLDGAQYFRESEREDNYIDVIQPFMGGKPNPEFIRAYPNRARDHFTDEELKDY